MVGGFFVCSSDKTRNILGQTINQLWFVKSIMWACVCLGDLLRGLKRYG
jgi:hypothetical protein